MGNYVFTTEALIDAVTRRRRGRELQARHGRQHRPGARRARRGAGLRLLAQRGAGRERRAIAATGATSGRSTPTTTRTWTSSRSSPMFNLYNQRVADPHLARSAAAGQVRLRRGRRRRGQALDSMVCAGVVISGGTVRRSVLSPGAHLHSYAEVEDSVAHAGRRRRPQRGGAPGDRRQERAHRRRARRSASTPRPTASASRSRRAGSSSSPRARRWRREGRAAHARVPARRLRRGRRPRRVPRARAAQARSTSTSTRGAPTATGAIGHEAWDALAGAGARAGRAARDVDRPDDGGGHRRGATSSTATPGTRTSAATSPSSSTTSRTWPPCTRSSRCARGRPSSSAAATRCRRSASAPRSRRPTRSSPSRTACASTCSPPTRRSTPAACRSIYNGIDTDEYAPDPGTDVLERHGIDPAAPTDRLRRAHHAPEGRRRTCCEAMRHVDAERPARAVRRRAGHAGDRRRGRAPRRGAAGPARQRAVARTRCCPSPR